MKHWFTLDRRQNASALASTYQSVREAAAQAQRARVPQMAAALSYRTIFGLLPVVIVALVLLKAFTSPKDLEGLIKAVLAETGITAIVVQDQTEPEGPRLPGHAGAAGDGVDPLGAVELGAGPTVPAAVAHPHAGAESTSEPLGTAAARRMDEWISDLIRRVNTISLPALGLIGMGALIYAAIGMLVEIERAFNQIYRSPQGRPWPSRVVLYWALMTLGPLALFATFYVGNQARALTERAVLAMPGASGEWGAVGVIAVGYLSTVLISGGVLLLLYTAVPWARVALRPAILGAIVAAIAWEASKWGFAQYLTFTRGQSYVRLYGSVALVPLFLLWVYVTWVVVLAGLQVSYFLQHGRHAGSGRNGSGKNGEEDLVGAAITNPPAAAIAVLAEMACRFKVGKASSPMQLARDLRLPFSGNASAVGEVLDRLEAAGFVHLLASTSPSSAPSSTATSATSPALSAAAPVRATRAEDPRWSGSWGLMRRRYALARPPESIRLADVVDAMLDRLNGTAETPVAAPSAVAPGPVSAISTALNLRDAQVRAMGERTLADIITR